jgi:predicted nuclease of predicted toxin-antitoxin system
VAKGRSVKLVFDECLPPFIAEALHKCGDKVVPTVGIETFLKLNWLGKKEPEWMQLAHKSGRIVITRDNDMINAHSLSQACKNHGITVGVLSGQLGTASKWEIALWMFRFLPRVANQLRSISPGNAWFIGKDGSVTIIP